jgi:hypothetical protein
MWVHRVTTFGAVRGPVLVAMAGVTVLLAAGCSQGASPAQVAHAEQVAVQAQVRKDATKQQQNAAASQKAHAVALKDEAAKAAAEKAAAEKAAAEKAAAEKAAAAKVAEVKAATAQAAAAKAAEAQAPVPTLGQIGGEATSDGQGFGLVRPSTVFNGGDPSGLLANVVWGSWGGPTAVGTGISDYSAPNQSVAGGTQLLSNHRRLQPGNLRRQAHVPGPRMVLSRARPGL